MTTTIAVDPLTRIEGHLAFRVETEGGKVTRAFVSGEMFRGIETILIGRDPLDAQQITQRICGVCSVEHGIASVLAQEMAYGTAPPRNALLLRNLLAGANYIHSHIAHFYLLSALDFIDITAVLAYSGKDPGLTSLRAWVEAETAQGGRGVAPAAPFLPRWKGSYIEDRELNLGAIRHYLDAIEMRALAHRMGTVFAGKLPHAASLIPGGITETVTAEKIEEFRAMLSRLRQFIDGSYIPDVLAVARACPDGWSLGRGCGSFLSYGVFPEGSGGSGMFLPAGTILRGAPRSLDPSKVAEDVGSSLFSSPSGLPPDRGETRPDPTKARAYSWLKAPRYSGEAVEVGPLARVLVAYHAGSEGIRAAVDGLLAAAGKTLEDLPSVLGRHAVRAVECRAVAERCERWLDRLVPGEPTFADFRIPDEGRGRGLTEAARGALGHWIEIRGKKVVRYQCVVPTTWNCSPRDDRGSPGPVEQALVGTPVADPANPIEAARVVRSFDPCIACAVH